VFAVTELDKNLDFRHPYIPSAAAIPPASRRSRNDDVRTGIVGTGNRGGRTTGTGLRTGRGAGTGASTRSRSAMISASWRGLNSGVPPADRSSRRFSSDRSRATGSRRTTGTVGIRTTVGTLATGPRVAGGARGISGWTSVCGSTRGTGSWRSVSPRRLARSRAMSRERWPGFACGSGRIVIAPVRIPLTSGSTRTC